MKDSILSNIKNLASKCYYKSLGEFMSMRTGRNSRFPKFILEGGKQNFINDLYIKNIVDYKIPSIDAHKQIINSLEVFLHPLKSSLLVYENNCVVGTLNLSDVIEILDTSIKINSSYCINSPVSCFMNRVFIALDFNSGLSEILVDILNSDNLIYPVYDNKSLKGVLHKDTILDIVKLQILEEAKPALK
jgi:predicted transcriptional regulator